MNEPMPDTALEVQQGEEERPLDPRWETLAKALSEGVSGRELRDLEISLKIMPPMMDKIKRDKTFIKMVEKNVRTLALYAVARTLPQMEVLAQKNVGAFTALAKIAGAWPGSEVNVNTQINVGDRSGDNDSDRAFHVAFQNRLRSGLVQRLIVLEGSKPQGTLVEQSPAP